MHSVNKSPSSGREGWREEERMKVDYQIYIENTLRTKGKWVTAVYPLFTSVSEQIGGPEVDNYNRSLSSSCTQGFWVCLQSGSDWPQRRQIRDVFRSYSVNLAHRTKYAESDLKKSRICLILGQSDPFWSQA